MISSGIDFAYLIVCHDWRLQLAAFNVLIITVFYEYIYIDISQ